MTGRSSTNREYSGREGAPLRVHRPHSLTKSRHVGEIPREERRCLPTTAAPPSNHGSWDTPVIIRMISIKETRDISGDSGGGSSGGGGNGLRQSPLRAKDNTPFQIR